MKIRLRVWPRVMHLLSKWDSRGSVTIVPKKVTLKKDAGRSLLIWKCKLNYLVTKRKLNSSPCTRPLLAEKNHIKTGLVTMLFVPIVSFQKLKGGTGLQELRKHLTVPSIYSTGWRPDPLKEKPHMKYGRESSRISPTSEYLDPQFLCTLQKKKEASLSPRQWNVIMWATVKLKKPLEPRTP